MFKPALWSRNVTRGLSVLGKALPGKMLEQGREGIVLSGVLYFGAGWLKKFLHFSKEFIYKPNNVIYIELYLSIVLSKIFTVLLPLVDEKCVCPKILNWGRIGTISIAFNVANITPGQT